MVRTIIWTEKAKKELIEILKYWNNRNKSKSFSIKLNNLIEEQLKGELKEDLQKELFKTVLNPYCDDLVYKLLASSSRIYTKVGVILGNICNFERAYLDVPKVDVKK